LYVKGYRPTEILAKMQKKFPEAKLTMLEINKFIGHRKPKLNGKYEVIINNPDGGQVKFHLAKTKVTKLISDVLGGEL